MTDNVRRPSEEFIGSEREKSVEDIFRRQVEEVKRRTQAESERRLAIARASVAQNPDDPDTYIKAARSCKQLGRLHEALEILRQGIGQCAQSVLLYEYYIERLEKCNMTDEAIAVARDASLLFPDELIFRLQEALILPVLYESQEQLDHYRVRFTEGLHTILRDLQLDTPVEKRRALAAVGRHVIKYLGYQGRNDRELRELYGGLVQRIMAANYPAWSHPLLMPPKQDGQRIRVGYVSARFQETSATEAFLGWIREHDRREVEVFAYHASRRTDDVTAKVRSASDTFRELTGSIEEDAPAILRDNLHVLVFLDVGMEPYMTQLGALHLAPIACVAWDYPVTSGLPSIDYFLSAESMEPNDAQDYYSEKLVLLPGLGVHYTKPLIPTGLFLKRRQDFGLRDGAVIYLSSQTIFKYLPEQDQLFAQIAKLVPNSQFVFLVTNEIVRVDFERRVARAFAAIGLDAADYCVMLPEMARLDYWSLHRNADVVLDTIGWSGGVSTFEAVALGVPVVTMPGRFMRGRQSYAILSQLGATETIAQNRDQYVEIAARLGLDPEWRQSIVQRMALGHSRVYSDIRCVRALEGFFHRVVDEPILF